LTALPSGPYHLGEGRQDGHAGSRPSGSVATDPQVMIRRKTTIAIISLDCLLLVCGWLYASGWRWWQVGTFSAPDYYPSLAIPAELIDEDARRISWTYWSNWSTNGPNRRRITVWLSDNRVFDRFLPSDLVPPLGFQSTRLKDGTYSLVVKDRNLQQVASTNITCPGTFSILITTDPLSLDVSTNGYIDYVKTDHNKVPGSYFQEPRFACLLKDGRH